MGLRAHPTAVITGAASGFGRALALALGARGGDLLLSDVNETGLAETARLARTKGAREVHTMACDVTKISDIEALSAFPVYPVYDLTIDHIVPFTDLAQVGESFCAIAGGPRCLSPFEGRVRGPATPRLGGIHKTSRDSV